MVIAGKNFYILLFGCTRQDNLYEVQQMERDEGGWLAATRRWDEPQPAMGFHPWQILQR